MAAVVVEVRAEGAVAEWCGRGKKSLVKDRWTGGVGAGQKFGGDRGGQEATQESDGCSGCHDVTVRSIFEWAMSKIRVKIRGVSEGCGGRTRGKRKGRW